MRLAGDEDLGDLTFGNEKHLFLYQGEQNRRWQSGGNVGAGDRPKGKGEEIVCFGVLASALDDCT